MLYIAFDACYAHPLPEKHRFPMIKYELLPKQLLHEGTCVPEQFFSPKPIEIDPILRVHTPTYYEQLCALALSKAEVRGLGFPLSYALIKFYSSSYKKLSDPNRTIFFLDLGGVLMMNSGTCSSFDEGASCGEGSRSW